VDIVTFSQLAARPIGTIFHVIDETMALGRVYIRGRVFCSTLDGSTAMLNQWEGQENLTPFKIEYADPLGIIVDDEMKFPAPTKEAEFGIENVFIVYSDNEREAIAFYFRHSHGLFKED
jgi:hypothetical protein